MVQVLQAPPRKKSMGQKFADAFAGAGQAVPEALETFIKGREERSKGIDKNLASLSPFISRELKARGRKTLADDPVYLAQLFPQIEELVRSGYSPKDAFDIVFSQSQGIDSEKQASEGSPFAKDFSQSMLGSLESPLPKQMGKISEDPSIQFIRKHPGKAAGMLGLGVVSPIEELITHPPSKAAQETLESLGFTYPEMQKETLSSKARSKLLEGVGERERLGARPIETIGSLLPIERIASFLSKALRGKGASKVASTAEKAAFGAQEEALAKSAQPERAAETALSEPKSLTGRVGKQELTPTEMRIQRAKIKEKPFPRAQREAIREQQLKSFPRYVEEIEADAAKRAAQAESRIPKTVKGKDAQKLRIHEAEKKFPKAQEDFQKASSRLRALEDEFASISKSQQEKIEPLMELARKDLKESEFAFKQATENLKGISSRAGLSEMRDAARTKMQSIQDAIQAGEEYKLAKMDYNPEHIKEAKRIAKKKPLPYTPKDDFYNQVHEAYINEYKNRLSQIERKIGEIGKERGLSGLFERQQLSKEKDVLKKMIDSAEAERTIHKHKFGLREMAERKKASERLAKFKAQEGKIEVKRLAQEKMWKDRIQELKTPEGRAKIAEEITENGAKENPKLASEIRKEKTKFQQALGELEKATENSSQSLANTPSSASSANKQSKNIAKQLKDSVDNLLSKVPVLGKTEWGKDVLKGIISSLFGEMIKESDLDLGVAPSTLATLALGRQQGAMIRIIAAGITKKYLQSRKIQKATELYKQHKDKELLNYSPAIRKKAKERAFG